MAQTALLAHLENLHWHFLLRFERHSKSFQKAFKDQLNKVRLIFKTLRKA